VGWLRTSNGSKASPSDAREKPPWAPPGTAAARRPRASSPASWPSASKTATATGGPSLLSWRRARCRARPFPPTRTPPRPEIVDLGRFYSPHLPRNVRWPPRNGLW